MALDKQSILNELGSVMNKLQSADCGCMGKMFTNQSGGTKMNPMGNSSGGCNRFGGCCHGHGGFHSGHGSGEPCMGKCNPRKMYADTYGYLNNNLMQPVVNEVYNDLKSLTPENTVMNNNAMAANMGLSSQGNMQGGNLIGIENRMQGQNAMCRGNHMQGGSPIGKNIMYEGNALQGSYFTGEGNATQEANYMQGNNMFGDNVMQSGYPMETENSMKNRLSSEMQGNELGYDMSNQKVQQMMGGIGPNILEMMKSNGKSKLTSSQPHCGDMPSQKLIDAPRSPHGTLGVMPLNATGGLYYNPEKGMLNNLSQQLATPTTQFVSGSEMISSGLNPYEQSYSKMNASRNMQQGRGNSNIQQNLKKSNMQLGQTNSNPTQKMDQPSKCNYGMHTQGMKKFSEMFPGGDLGFDPMAIAIQMNPENHKRSAMDAIQNMMSGNKKHMDKALVSANAAVSPQYTEPTAANQHNNPPANRQPVYGQLSTTTSPISQIQQYGSGIVAQATTANQVLPLQQQVLYNANAQQQSYSGSLQTNQEQLPSQEQYLLQQQMANPSSGASFQPTYPSGNQEAQNPYSQGLRQAAESTSEQQPTTQDPIFPADTSRPFVAPLAMRRQKFYQYNTLGQPVDVYPAKMFQSAPETNLPQTLCPQLPSGKLRKDASRFNIKSTVSKTSLMGNKPIGGTPSRNQLQNIYNQYKGSQSSTQQHIRNSAGHANTNSEGKLCGIPRVNVTPAPVERVGGDGTVNNQSTALHPVKQLIQEHGDVIRSNKLFGDTTQTQEAPKSRGNVRNGLQDMVYTAYPTSAAWSFHGDSGMRYYHRGNRNTRGRA